MIQNEEYARKVLPFLKPEYFSDAAEQLLFVTTQEFITQYNKSPTLEALSITLNKADNVQESNLEHCMEILETIKKSKDEKPNDKWLLDKSEEFCQEKAIYNAIHESLEIIDDSKKSANSKGAIPKILSDALGISFDPQVGHDFLEESDDRYEYYHQVENKIPFDIEFFNKITNGGICTKTLNVLLGGVHVGKTLNLCHLAAGYLNMGRDVLYITLEEEAFKIAKRIDANLLNVPLDDIDMLSKGDYEKRIDKLKTKTQGKLIIKEYPTASASVVQFRSLLNELHLKKNFKPKIVIVDYLNICASARIKNREMLYQYVKSVAEELRGLFQEFDVGGWSAAQFNRTGYGNSDPDMTDTAESFGLPATADLMLAIQTSDELEQLNQYLYKQLKNRYRDYTKNKRFVIGVDRPKQRLYDVSQAAQEDLMNDDTTSPSPKFDKTSIGQRMKAENLKGLKV